jgi:hypothetical protein
MFEFRRRRLFAPFYPLTEENSSCLGVPTRCCTGALSSRGSGSLCGMGGVRRAPVKTQNEVAMRTCRFFHSKTIDRRVGRPKAVAICVETNRLIRRLVGLEEWNGKRVVLSGAIAVQRAEGGVTDSFRFRTDVRGQAPPDFDEAYARRHRGGAPSYRLFRRSFCDADYTSADISSSRPLARPSEKPHRSRLIPTGELSSNRRSRRERGAWRLVDDVL